MGTNYTSKRVWPLVILIDLECLFVVVGARKREFVHGIQKAPPLSGDCFWQLEKANAPLNGETFVFILCFMRGTLAIIILKNNVLIAS